MTSLKRPAAWTLAAIIYAVGCAVAAIFIAARLLGGALDTDIQNLLPSGAVDPVVRAAMIQAGGAVSSRVAMVVSAKDPEVAERAAADLTTRLKNSGAYVDAKVDGEQTARWLFSNRNALSCTTRPELFDEAAAKDVVRSSLAALYAPIAPISSDMLQRDPFLLTLRLSGCLLPQNQVSQSASVLVSGRLIGSAYRVDTQDRFIAIVDQWRHDHAADHIEFARAGAAFHATKAAANARGDMSTIGFASLAGVTLLMLVVFRRLAVLGYALLVVGAGYAGSLALTLAIFKTINILVFVFGAAFVGVTADYAIYYLATGPQTGWATAAARRRLIFKPVTLCMATSAVGFLCLGLFHVPIFRQLAVFAVGGLLSAWFCAFAILPWIDRASRAADAKAVARSERRSAAWFRTEKAISRKRSPRAGWVVFLMVAAVAVVVGALRYSVLDDVRQFQPQAPDLIADEIKVRAVVGSGFSANFILSQGPTLEAAKAVEEKLLSQLSPAALSQVLAVSRFDPTAVRRAANSEEIRSGLIEPNLADREALLGLKVDPYGGVGAVALPAWLGDLQGGTGKTSFVIAPVGEGAAAEVAALAARTPGATYVDPAAVYTRAFATYRRAAVAAVGSAMLIIGFVLMLVYRTPRAISIMIAPLLGAISGVVVSSAFGVPISFFSLMGVFVVIGTGADYSVLQWERARGHTPTQGQLPILVTSLTSILSMGLLSLSATYPVKSFGVTVATGLIIAYCLSTIASNGGIRNR